MTYADAPSPARSPPSALQVAPLADTIRTAVARGEDADAIAENIRDAEARTPHSRFQEDFSRKLLQHSHLRD